MFWFGEKEYHSKLSNDIVVGIIKTFMEWYHNEITLYEGKSEQCMVRNLATINPIMFFDQKTGDKYIDHYFIISNNTDQRVATRLQIFISKLNLIFGQDVIDEFKARCLTSLVNDYHFSLNLLNHYIRKSDLFWTYPLFLIEGNIDMCNI